MIVNTYLVGLVMDCLGTFNNYEPIKKGKKKREKPSTNVLTAICLEHSFPDTETKVCCNHNNTSKEFQLL